MLGQLPPCPQIVWGKRSTVANELVCVQANELVQYFMNISIAIYQGNSFLDSDSILNVRYNFFFLFHRKF